MGFVREMVKGAVGTEMVIVGVAVVVGPRGEGVEDNSS